VAVGVYILLVLLATGTGILNG